jgi:hypothetical protein
VRSLAHNWAAKFRDKTLPFYDQFHSLFSTIVASGEFAFGGKELVDDPDRTQDMDSDAPRPGTVLLRRLLEADNKTSGRRHNAGTCFTGIIEPVRGGLLRCIREAASETPHQRSVSYRPTAH